MHVSYRVPWGYNLFGKRLLPTGCSNPSERTCPASSSVIYLYGPVSKSFWPLNHHIGGFDWAYKAPWNMQFYMGNVGNTTKTILSPGSDQLKFIVSLYMGDRHQGPAPMRLVSLVIVQVPRCFICSIKSPNVVAICLKGFWNWSTYDRTWSSGSPVTWVGSPCM